MYTESGPCIDCFSSIISPQSLAKNEATIANLLILIWQLYLYVSFEPPQ